MQSLFGFHETLEMVTNGGLVLVANATNAQRVSHKDTKKKIARRCSAFNRR